MSMFSKLKQFKDLREQGKKLQGALSGETVSTDAAQNRVRLSLNGNLEITALAIDDELMSPDKKEKLQEAIKDAHREAQKKMQRIIATKMQEMGGFDIPGLTK